uniref:HU family DNA-binding protein n=1 Tax=Prevotella sp. TaxID=59823 RepID=UPI003FF144E3
MSKNSLNVLAEKLAEKSGLSQIESELFIRKMFDVCHQGLAADKMVKMRWLGTFKVTSVKDRESVDVNTGERIIIEGRDKISFTPDNILKEIVNKPFAQFETVVVNEGVDFDSIDKKYEDSLEDEEQEREQEVIKPAVDVVEPLLPENSFSTESTASGVIDFLDIPETPSEESNVVVIGEETAEISEEKESEVDTSVQESEKVMEETMDSCAETVESHGETSNELPVSDSLEEPKEEFAANVSDNSRKDISDNEAESDDEAEIRRRHFIIPKYTVIVASIILLLLIGGFGWFAFNYGQMAAQRDHLALQLAQYKEGKESVMKFAKVKSQEQILQQKARQDSLRMAQASEAVKAAEKADSLKTIAAEKAMSEKNQKSDHIQLADNKKVSEKVVAEKKMADQKKLDKAAEHAKVTSGKYDSDPRVRTGAYRIIGVDQIVTVGDHQTLSSLSKRYLGPGMECYIEALNGNSTIKSGQKIKIPKLELKKKKAK